VRTLVANLFYAHNAAARGVIAIVDVGSMRLAVDTAIPCGLIINELVTNALKHAFHGCNSGCVRVGMQRIDANQLELRVQDDGIGFPATLDPRQVTTLGLDLVYTFAEQLDAEVGLIRDGGTIFCLKFAASG